MSLTSVATKVPTSLNILPKFNFYPFPRPITLLSCSKATQAELWLHFQGQEGHHFEDLGGSHFIVPNDPIFEDFNQSFTIALTDNNRD